MIGYRIARCFRHFAIITLAAFFLLAIANPNARPASSQGLTDANPAVVDARYALPSYSSQFTIPPNVSAGLSMIERGIIDPQDAGSSMEIQPWTQLAHLGGSDGAEDDQFGNSVAIDGNTVVVGARNKSIGDNEVQGQAYVFIRPENGWSDMTEVARLSPSDGGDYYQFGWKVAVSGDTIAVSAPSVGIGGVASAGKIYIFEKPETGWHNMTQTAVLTVSDPDDYTYLGWSLAMEGDTIVAGTPGKDKGPSLWVGAVYIFIRQGAHWSDMTQSAKLTASDGASNDMLGESVAFDGETIVAGAFHDDNYRGSAYVFTKPAGGWVNNTEDAKLTASDGAQSDWFGEGVAINADTVVVGAPKDDIGENLDQGSVYVYIFKSVTDK
jgi:hypothetical protein